MHCQPEWLTFCIWVVVYGTIHFQHKVACGNVIITFGVVRFRVEKVSDTYTIAVPVDDPLWMMRTLERHCSEQAWKAVEMKLNEKQLESLIASRTQYNALSVAQRSLEEEKLLMLTTLYEELNLAVPGMTLDELRGFLELGEIQ